MNTKRALGRGLDALIPAADPARPGLRQVPVHQIAPNPHQPRQRFDPDALAELAASIKEHGLIQPLIVSQIEPTDDAPPGCAYWLIAGERRLEAAKLIGLEHVPAIVQQATPQQMLELALVENIQRADLNPLEEAAAYRQLAQDFSLTQQEIADRVGKGRVAVANALRLLRLPPDIQTALADGQISEGHARALLPLEGDIQAMQQVFAQVIAQGLSVRQTEELVRRRNKTPPSPKARRTVSPDTAALESEFQRSLGTKVQLSRSEKGGRLTIHFYSEEELQRLYDLLIGRS